ncbi:hypothetical protein M231_00864 [Tremella mesenterica]|uniref:Programmed cell death protein 5 n=1 Tax=Tremella mesenterica TaxID=5217 RepID=A0A4Q1BUU3_TREME|nr:uncharacterized protein TREMEDRAFT_70270 [Tremella mesenterica DSM 1558]EIW66180.1 hypothetical protein TREMEDRAFT_70270 [Tremella mesenterica DSM 1558]RXK41865.1 hypothetical protein M231_00864 [Tremella mesenterica]
MSNISLPPGMRAVPAPTSQPQGVPSGQGPSTEEKEAKERQMGEMKRGMIAAMLESEARERLSRIALTRPELAAQVEDLLIRMGQSGQIRGKVNDENLKGLLQQVTDMSQPKPKPKPITTTSTGTRTKSLAAGITIHRKRDESDDEEYDL